MSIRHLVNRFIGLIVVLALTACGGGGGGGDDDAGSAVPLPQSGIGAAGGSVSGPNGSKVVVPAGALSANLAIEIAQASAGTPALPSGLTLLGPMFAFTPHGTTFASPVTVTLPFDPALIPTGSTPALYKTNAQNQWEVVPSAVFGATTVTGQVSGFSFVAVLVPPLVAGELFREWTFSEYRGEALEEVEVDKGSQVNGLVHELHDFGPTFRDSDVFDPDGSSLPPDEIATGQIASLPDGKTFWVGAEAPGGIANLPEAPIGSITQLRQVQTFIKRTAEAKLSFTISAAFIETTDLNAPLHRLCPPHLVIGLTCDFIKGELFFWAQAYTVPASPNIIPFDTFFSMAGGATLQGFEGSWDSDAWTPRYSFDGPLWNVGDFDFVIDALEGQPESLVLMILRGPRIVNIDLSEIAVGQAFTLDTFAYAKTYNRIAGPPSEFGSSATAFLRDPQSSSGAIVEFSGLDPVDDIAKPLGIEIPVQPAACTSGPAPDPAAGVLAFSNAAFIVGESNTTPIVTVERRNGTNGAVSVTFTTSNGTAVADVDYKAMNVTVFFADGEEGERVVEVPIIQDAINGEPDKTVNMALSQPGGCAALGAQTTAVLTIHDDDRPPPPAPAGTFLDPNFGEEGLASSPGFGGDRSAMALQADGKIVIVGGRFTDFVLARFNANGTLDTSFDADGKVTTDMVANEQEEALGVAIQPDGKIVVVGYTGTAGPGGPANFAIARYNSNGSLDTSFGTGGKITSGVLGNAYAVVVQSDSKIVVVGDVSVSRGNDFADFVVARFNSNGTPDISFSGDGQAVTDIGAGTNTARNVVLQSDGAIVVSGEPIGTFTGSDHTDIARYATNGALDGSFGTAGLLTLSGARVGEGLAIQGDGKLVLVGSIDASVPPAAPGTVTNFAVMRRNANGTPDTNFGGTGSVSTPISDERDAALAVTMQADGKIVVAGSTSNINANFAVARYNTNGTLDSSFGGDASGKLTIDFFGFTDFAESVAVQPDGKIVLGGLARDNSDGYGLTRIAQ